jgi:DNA-binding response OmpR family regulator
MDHRRHPSRALHVLVVDDDLAILKETCERLGSEGHRVSAFSRAVGVRQVIAALQPDVVLIDVLMPDLSRRSLHELLARCAIGGTPMVILHSRVAERTLCALANIDGSAGVIRKTDSPLAFALAFNAIVERVSSPESWPSLGAGIAASGTHRVGDESDENDDTMNTGGRRGAG